MSNPVFYIGDLEEATYTSSVAEDAAFPLANLKTYYPSDIWKSSSTANAQTLNIDFGSAKARDFFIIAGHNFLGMSAVTLQYDSTDNPAFPSPFGFALNGTADPYVNPLGGLVKRYWRIMFTSIGGVKPQLGQIFINQKFDAGFTQIFPYAAKNEAFATTVKRALSGRRRSSQTSKGILTWNLTFEKMPESFKTAWLRFHQKVRGAFLPFYFVDTDGNMWFVNLGADANDISAIMYQINNTGGVTLETVDVNQNPIA